MTSNTKSSLSPSSTLNNGAWTDAALKVLRERYLHHRTDGRDETPEEMAEKMEGWARDGLVNIVGGCCGSTPEHIAALKSRISQYPPRAFAKVERKMRLSGLEPFVHA